VDRELAVLLAERQYSLPQVAKEQLLLAGLDRLTVHHATNCIEYARILRAACVPVGPAHTLADVPYLPVSLFKWLDLKSVPSEAVFKVMTSSGTTSHVPSRIALDVETARLQTQALARIVTHFIGNSRRPLLIVDHPGVVRDRHEFSARGAGILGMLPFGRDPLYALDAQMRLDRPALGEWLGSHATQPLLIFGFTSLIWEHLLGPLRGAGIDLSDATLIHSGGWKRLSDAGISNDRFKSDLRDAFGLTEVHNFYGMVEQVGSVFFECPSGFFHPPNFGDVILRDPQTWQPVDGSSPGVVEVLSLLPTSYPGHALLTEDLGVLHGIDDCPCGRLGKRFTIQGRVPKVEIRGCSDTYERPT
jgi:hypothetical protein